MSLSTDLTIRGTYGAAAPNRVYTASGNGDFSQIFSAVYQSGGGTNYENYFQLAADTYQLPVNLLKAVAKAESDFNANAVSSCGAQGIMQLMPVTARSLGVTDSFDPAQNIMGGAKYLRQMLDSFDGDVSKAVAAYNAGPNAVRKYNGIPPYQETQNYVTKVLGYAGSSLSASVAVPAPTASSSAASLTQEDLTELIFQAYHANGLYSKESMSLLVQQLLQQKEREAEDDGEEYIRI